MKRARKRAKAQEAKQKSPKRLRLLSKKKSESDKIEQAMTGDEQMAIDMYEATQEKRRKVTVIDSQLMFEVTNGPILCKYYNNLFFLDFQVLADDSSDSEAEAEAASKAVEGEEGDDGVEDEDEEKRRSITFQIQKNKGLTPKRPKMQRNPRVKHRFKFDKAKKRRKGAVREARSETKRYGGEVSGINARVKKGVKLA